MVDVQRTGTSPTVSEPEQIALAAEALVRGELVGFPTETVYGLGADASNPQAVARIFTAKGRPSDHPVIVHVASAQAAAAWARDLAPQARALMDAFWPGPLTLILRRADWVDPCVSGGQDTIGLRCPSHPVAQSLLQVFGHLCGNRPAGIAAPSANRFGQVSPTTSAHVRHEFGDLVHQGMPVLEGGATQVGIESTIVDLSRLSQGHGPALLRPGSILPSDIESVIGLRLAGHDAQAPRVSGALKAHYAPNTPMRLVPTQMMADTVKAWFESNSNKRLAVVLRQTACETLFTDGQKSDFLCYAMPDQPAAYAQALYAQLRAIDLLGVDQIFWEEVPDTEPWAGVRDRLQRAAAAF